MTPRTLVDSGIRRVRERGRSAITRAARLAGATVAAFVVAQVLGLSDPPPLVAALTALLVVQVTLSGTLVNGVQRVVSVMAGVGLALAFASVTGLSWWSLGALVAASIVVGQLLRLGPHLIEVPISAMLVLGVGYVAGAESAAAGRALETLVGAAVGVLVNLAVPPRVQSRDAGRAVVALAGEMGTLLDAAAVAIGPGPLVPAEDTARWLDDARRVNRHVPRVDQRLAEAEESRRLNVRALAERDGGIGQRDGLDALEHCSVALRGLFRALHDRAAAGGEPAADAVAELRAELLSGMARAVRTFGAVLAVEAGGREPTVPEAGLAAALTDLRATRERIAAQPRADAAAQPDEWELDAALLIAADRMIGELDVAEHARARAALRTHRVALHPPKISLQRHRPRRRRPAPPDRPLLHTRPADEGHSPG